MSKKLKTEGVRTHVVLYARDLERLNALVASHTGSSLTRSDLIRDIIHTFLNRIDEKTNEKARHVTSTDPASDTDGIITRG